MYNLFQKIILTYFILFLTHGTQAPILMISGSEQWDTDRTSGMQKDIQECTSDRVKLPVNVSTFNGRCRKIDILFNKMCIFKYTERINI